MPSGIYKRTKKTKRNVYFQKGKKFSEEHKKRLSIAFRGNTNGKGNKGKRLTEEHKRKIGEAEKGKKHWNWKGGTTLENYSNDWTDTLKEAIRQRDDYICQECGIHQDELINWVKKLDIHHIDYDKKNCNPNNLISLCRKCHLRTNYNRNYWINYFKNANSNSKSRK